MRTIRWLGIFALLAAVPASAGERGAGIRPLTGKVTFVAGPAEIRHAGRTVAAKVDSVVLPGDEVSTGPASRLELTLFDRSIVRLGPGSRFVVKQASWGRNERFTAKLLFGQLWAKVASVLGGRSRFDVETENAVAGVRGTTFRVDAHHDRSVLVRVYAGAVAIASANRLPTEAHAPARERHEVPGPQEVDRRSYEKLLAKMMELKVSASGELGEPRPFTASDEAGDDWVAWNTGRDAR